MSDAFDTYKDQLAEFREHLKYVDGASGLEKALGLVWPDALVQRGNVHKHPNLLGARS